MNEMVERVAKAAHDKLFTDCINRSDWPTTNCSINANGFRDAARAAIAAMRVPTEAMVEACDGMVDDAASPYDHWCRMIDAALTE